MKTFNQQIKFWTALACGLGVPASAHAHATEQGFVLLLPTGHYILAGVLSVIITALLLAFLPGPVLLRLFSPRRMVRFPAQRWALAGSTLSLTTLLLVLIAGRLGPADPLSNALSLFVWTVFWVGFVSLQGVAGNLWCMLNPFNCWIVLIQKLTGGAMLRLPSTLNSWPAVALFLGFAALLLADPAPADPVRLFNFVTLYLTTAFVGVAFFGQRWLVQAEFLTVFLRLYSKAGCVARDRNSLSVGFFGWQILSGKTPHISLAILILILLGSGSFDGLNETFWWLGLLGINPLEFPGRSAVIIPNIVGLVLANLILITAFALSIRAGLALIKEPIPFLVMFRRIALAILPIALGYHIAHYLPAFLVDSQWVIAALSDPLANGADYLGLGTYYVTTGFFNRIDTVQIIWLTQAGAVVIGHVISILLAHGLAFQTLGDIRAAALSQLPMAGFMVGYTWFGLWLLAAPKGG